MYLIQVSGNEGDGITSCRHLDEATKDSVPHWSVLIHAMEQITQPVTSNYRRDGQVIEWKFDSLTESCFFQHMPFVLTVRKPFSCFSIFSTAS